MCRPHQSIRTLQFRVAGRLGTLHASDDEEMT